jgi:fructose-bisphosphate aldolase class I
VKHNVMIASFSRALTEEITAQLSDAEFNGAPNKVIESVYQASKT